ncbi:MAG: aldose 1-epimerase [Saprospiraceae bacterium]|jgi:aldose 1-epimerase|nr:aldose 1-epimerase [Saprospiraceae bacterium]
MSFQHYITSFGSYEQHIVSQPERGCSLALVPGYGACVLDLQLCGVSILDGYQTPEELQINRGAKNTVLFPFPNRLKDGRYEWEGNYYFFTINDAATHTALHGFGMDKPMQVSEIRCEEDQAHITCVYSPAMIHQAYPFRFTYAITFSLYAPDRFEVTLHFTNDMAITIPVGLGWHPYYQLSDSIDNLVLQLPPCEMVGIDQQMIPTGKRYEYDEYAEPKRLGADILDNCFALSPQEGKAQIMIKGEKGRLRYWQETGRGKFNFIQLFTPPHRQSLAVEPMTCNIDAFNNGEGLIVVKAGETISARFGIQFDLT